MVNARLDAGFLHLNGERYPIAHTNALPSGQRAIQRGGSRPAQITDPSRLQQAEWKLSGSMGRSRERPDRVLGIDFATLEHRYDDILTSPTESTFVDLTAFDIAGSGGSASLLPLTLPFTLGGVPGVAATAPLPVTHIHEDRGDLFAARGNGATQVRPDTMVAVATETFDVAILGAAVWFAKGYYGFGDGQAMQRRSAVSLHGGATYVDVSASNPSGDVKTSGMTVGPDRLYMVRGDAGEGIENRIRFTFDAVDNLSNPFLVGDPIIPPTGLGTIGPFITVGSEIGAFSFTSDGKPIRVVESLKDHRSANNALQFASFAGWQYLISDVGLLAIIPGEVESFVGPGAIIGFEGPSGQATAVAVYKNAVWLAEKVGADSFIWRGVFGPETRATGQLDWYFMDFLPGTDVQAIAGTGLRPSTTPTLLAGDNDNLRWYQLSQRDREIADLNYRYSLDGGEWFGTTLTRNPNLHKTLRQAMIFGKDLDASNTFQLATSLDDGVFTDFGPLIQSDGHQILRPVTGSPPVPAANLGFHNCKPRLTQVAGNRVTPPTLLDSLTMVYDERPEVVEEMTVTIMLGQEGRDAETEWDEIQALVGHTQTQPVLARLPMDREDIFTHVSSLEENRDLQGDAVMGANVGLLQWRVA